MRSLYGFAYTDTALASLSDTAKKLRRQIINKIKTLATNPRPRGCKKLNGVMDGTNPVYRLRQGDYRILYCVRDGPVIVILDIGHRKDVYRGLP